MNEALIPKEGEYAAYYAKYIAQVADKDIFKVLMEQLEEVRSVFDKLGEEGSCRAYAEGKWTAKEVLGHMTDTDRVMAFRALSIARGEKQSLPGFDQDTYVKHGGFNEISLVKLLEEFEMTRYAIVAMLNNLPETVYGNMGNANNTPVSVRGLIYIIAGHTLHHLAILNDIYI